MSMYEQDQWQSESENKEKLLSEIKEAKKIVEKMLDKNKVTFSNVGWHLDSAQSLKNQMEKIIKIVENE